MENGFHDFTISEIIRKLANLIRIGKIHEIDGSLVKVRIGQVITDWLPVVSGAGETVMWNPISKDELVAVFFPYGETAQGFVLRSIHYTNYKAPENTQDNSINTPFKIKINGSEGLEGEFGKDFSVKCGSGEIKLSEDLIQIQNKNCSISLSNDGIVLRAGGGTLTIGDGISINGKSVSLSGDGANIKLAGSVDISGTNVTTSPPVCRCGV